MIKKYELDIATNLDPQIIKKYQNNFESCFFHTDSPLFYEGHIPIVAYIVLQGSVQFEKKKKLVETLSKNTVIGVKHVLEKNPSPFTAKALASTKVLFLDRSTLLDLQNTPFGQALAELIPIINNI